MYLKRILIIMIFISILFFVNIEPVQATQISDDLSVGDTWSYTSSQGSTEDKWSTDSTDFIEPIPTDFGSVIAIVNIDFLDYWEFSYIPDRPVANISFGIGDLSQTNVNRIEITSAHCELWSRVWSSGAGEYIADDYLGSLESFDLSTTLYSYDSVEANDIEFSWWSGFPDPTVRENNAYMEFRVLFTVYETGTGSTDYWGWMSGPDDSERPDIDVEPRGNHVQTGTYDFEITQIIGTSVTIHSHGILTNSWGDVMNDYESTMPIDIDEPEWSMTPIVVSVNWPIMTSHFLDYCSTNSLVGSVSDQDLNLLGAISPTKHFTISIPAQGRIDLWYSEKSGVLVKVDISYSQMSYLGTYAIIELSSADFEYAYTDPNLSMLVTSLDFSVGAGSSFDIDILIINDGEITGDFELEVISSGFAGSLVGDCNGLSQKSVNFTVTCESSLTPGTYNILVRLLEESTAIDQQDVSVDVLAASFDIPPTTMIGIAAGAGGIVLVVLLVALKKRN